MTRLPIHAKASRHPGAVCGADDGSLTRITTDGHHVTCEDCIGLVDLDVLPDDAVAGDPHVIDLLRAAVRGAFKKIDGVIVDATTAHAILTVYDALNDANKARLAALRIDRMAAVAWALLRPRTEGDRRG